MSAQELIVDASAPSAPVRRAKARAIQERVRRLTLAAWSLVGLTLLMAPVLIVVPMSFSAGRGVAFPPEGFSLQWYERLFHDPLWLEALRTSLLVAVLSSMLAVLTGGLASYGLVKRRSSGRVLFGMFMMPMIVPSVVLAVAQYLVFAKVGLLGSLTGLILAHAVLALPFVVLIMSTAIRAIDARLEEAARSLGASRLRALRSVIVPILMPHLIVSWIFAFVVSFDEIVITFFVSGTHVTIPKKMFITLRNEIDPTITAVSTLLIAVTLLVGIVAALLLQRRFLTTVSGAVQPDSELSRETPKD